MLDRMIAVPRDRGDDIDTMTFVCSRFNNRCHDDARRGTVRREVRAENLDSHRHLPPRVMPTARS